MNDPMLTETILISSAFFAVALVLIASVLFLERRS
jgi:hypothetical protein